MAALQQLVATANRCTPKAETPTAVLPEMVKARLGSVDAFERLQGTVDYLTCLAKAGQTFTADQKEFMHDLFEAFAFGGRVLGMPEAAKLAYHYVNGQGALTTLPSSVYESSVIVKDASSAMAAYLATTVNARPNSQLNLSSRDANFLRSSQARPLLKTSGRRSAQTQGSILTGGTLIAEQSNVRLKNADHRFVLACTASKRLDGRLDISWTVRSTYDFDPFSRAAYWTDIPLGQGRTLKLPDGLSEYISQPHIGVANAFDHVSSWRTTWP